MSNMRISTISTLLAILVLVSAMPHAHQKIFNNEDDFWAKKPMHTTDLMAGRARTTIKHSTTYTQIPTATPRIEIQYEEVNEL
ncbi:uncharacterized protein M421DRAFT_422530 [Didymella exigua CBS 183.55]|uniref:Uncharacterized protein n=1 Tax=Didymella exigua CBS 183.55 TaxID=1150837 RepID=A0A6A5RE55_9PLEO|nr:uncharacterized protein M421DRAFT_422530 [Didymella exigua CBS 183.55]KAF1926555.1 hypothetical protein M421DRAFT_422530 [Didymella exigua CBS 183.55]